MRKLTFFTLFLSVAFSSFCQFGQLDERKKKECFNNGLFFYETGEHKEALYNFMQLYFADTGNANVNYKIAMCYFNIPGQELKSIPYLKRASHNITVDYKEYSFNNQDAPLHTLFFLGKAYRLSGQLDKALKVIEEFTKSPYYAQYNPSIVEREINTIKRAKILIDQPVEYKITNLGEAINNETANKKPVISYDGNTLVYLNKLKLYDAIFLSHKENGKWGQARNISAEIGSDGAFYPTSLNHEGTELYLVKKTDGKGDIYVSFYNDTINRWSLAQRVSDEVNSRNNETHACISPDGNTLYFSTDNKGRGGLDIYYSTKDDDGLWSKPKNLSKVINTDMDEDTPFLTANGNMLFFSSQGHYNIGEFDVFYSRLDAEGEWSEPKKPGLSTKHYYQQPVFCARRRWQQVADLQAGH
jgi:hypothetical protein